MFLGISILYTNLSKRIPIVLDIYIIPNNRTKIKLCIHINKKKLLINRFNTNNIVGKS